MNLFAVSSLVTASVSVSSGLFVYLKNRKRFLNKIFALLMFSIAIWSFGLANLAVAPNELKGLFWDRFLYFGSLLIPSLFFHFVLTFLGLRKERKKLLMVGYIFSFLFLIFNFTPLFRERMISAQALHFNYLPETGPIYPIFPLMFLFYVGYSLYLMFKRYRKMSRVTRNQIKYAFLAAIIGFGGGSTTFLPAFGIKTSPMGNCLVALYGVILAYAIVTYRLMDIEVVINKTVLFGILIGGIIGFHIGFVTLLQGMIGYGASTVLSVSIILFVLFFTPFRRKLGGFVDVLVYRGKYDYQKVLKDSTKALVTMLDLRQLLNYIVNTISDTVGVEKISLFLKEGNKRKYEIKASCGLDEELVDKYVLKPDEGIIPWLKQSKAVFVKEEMERALPGKAFESIHGDLGKIGAEFILPLFYKDNLVGVLNLSHKQSGGIYNQTDIDILESLGAEAAVAIENARLHTEVITDELTGLYQPRYFELRLREEIEMAKRYSHCLSLMMVEIYNLEEMKKKYGEEEKDNLLKNIASIVSGNLRMGDIACRCGEDGFGIILPEITEEPGVNIRERLKRQIKETVEIGERLRRRVDEEQLGVTVSIGIASFDGQDREMKRETLIKQAKEALSQAQRGGNTVKVFYDEKLRKEISSEVLEWIKETEETLVSGETCVDLTKHTVQVKGKPVKLTPKAFDLLCLLMKKKGRVLNRSFLTESIWGYEYFGTTRTVDSHIKSLR
ncbi:MAG: diguanylate cyclase, partial [Elusimicrobiota bacterium]|nr:diguanylate cyclase [Elusimicrobiota bacterium]